MNPNQKREDNINKFKKTMKSDYTYQVENNERYQQLVFGKAVEAGQAIKKELEAVVEKFKNVSYNYNYKKKK
jgi:hypothetical protein